MKTIYCVIGNANSGKSSIIRALTGLGSHNRSKKVTITFLNNTLHEFFVQTSAAQEKNLDVSRLIREINRGNCEYNLIALRFDRPSSFPNYLSYLSRFETEGWNIKKIVLLGNHELLTQYNPILLRFNNPQNQTINKNAADIRKNWGWY
jgi:Fe2+ transport system protein B